FKAGWLGRMKNVPSAVQALRPVIDDSAGLVLALMQWLGQSPTLWLVNSEIRDLAEQFPAGPLFRFLRYDVRLEADWLAEHLGMKLSGKGVEAGAGMETPHRQPRATPHG